MSYQVNVGDPLPAFEVKDQEGRTVTDQDLLGRMTVLYFYPKDDTPGCTKEACSFRDGLPHFEKIAAQIYGVSPDTVSSHRDFLTKHHLTFPLLSDENKKMCQAFDVWREKESAGQKNVGVERTTFISNEDGIIVWIERPVKVENHVERVLEAIHFNQ